MEEIIVLKSFSLYGPEGKSFIGQRFFYLKDDVLKVKESFLKVKELSLKLRSASLR